MEKSNYLNRMHLKGARRGVALLLLFAILLSIMPAATAATASDYEAEGFVPAGSSLTLYDSTVKVYIKTAVNTTLLDKSGGTFFVGKGAWLQLKAMAYYEDTAGSGAYYAMVYCNNKEYSVLMDEIYDCVQSEASLLSYIKGTLWTQSQFESLAEADGLKRDIRVHALQLALNQLDYLSDTPDGSFGPNTTKAVKAFQRKEGLNEDGVAGNATQKALYAIALGGASSSGSTSGSTSGGSSSASISPSASKTYVQLEANTNIFKTATTSTGISVPKGTVLQLVANQYYTGSDGLSYMCLYYDNVVYNVLTSDISGSIMTTAQFTSYVTGTLWTAQVFVSLNDDKELRGDVRVHGLQYALQLLGHYSGALDGNFGSGTKSAVRSFQRANKLTVDGRAGPLTQKALYAAALTVYNGGTVGNITGGSSGSPGTSTETTTTSTGTLVTLDSVNLRKSASTSSARLAVVPRSTTLTYIDSKTSGGVTWYKVIYSGHTGWLMGTFVSASGSTTGNTGNTGNTGTGTTLGTITITKPNTRVRKTPNGSKTGVVMSLGSQLSYYSQTSAAGYTWYYIRTPSGIYGYVRGDCAKVDSATTGSGSSGGGSSTILPSSTKTYISTSKAVNVFLTEEMPTASGSLTIIPAGSVIQLVSTTTYTKGGVEYCSLYYNNVQFNAVYADVKADIMTSDGLTTYITGTLWKAGYTISLKEELGLKGDIRVHSAQLALTMLGYYTGAMDGTFGGATTSAVRNFQRRNNLTVDGSIGPKTWIKLFPMAISAYASGSNIPGGTTGDTGTTTTTFGAVISVQKESWSNINNNSLFPKSSAAAVMDVKTGRVFKIYRWSGGSHADCVPYSAGDTKIMCDIVGFPYNSSHPTSDQLSRIKADSANNNTTYAWPDFRNTFGGGVNIGSAWDRRPALVNVNGYVYCASIYGWPHGIGDSSFASATLNGAKFTDLNNYYGMMCVHFVGSTTHTGTSPDTGHQAAIDEAYAYAKTVWPTLCK